MTPVRNNANLGTAPTLLDSFCLNVLRIMVIMVNGTILCYNANYTKYEEVSPNKSTEGVLNLRGVCVVELLEKNTFCLCFSSLINLFYFGEYSKKHIKIQIGFVICLI